MQGYIKDYRKELNSDIWMMPPLYHRTWQYLKYKANHRENKIPMKDGTFITIMPGQHLTSIRDVAKSVGWYEGVKWKEPNPKTIKSVLDWLTKQGMITVDNGNRKYTLISLLNWEIYQSNEDEGNSGVLDKNGKSAVKGNTEETEKTPSHQGENDVEGVSGNSKVTAREQSVGTNKNDKECIKNDKEKDVVVAGASENEESEKGIEGMPTSRDAVPTSEHDADSSQKKISISDYRNQVTSKYLQRRAKGFDLSAKDLDTMEEIISQRIPLRTVLEGIDKAFDEYKPEHIRDEIRSLNYCAPIIYDLHIKKQKSQSGGSKSKRRKNKAVDPVPESFQEAAETSEDSPSVDDEELQELLARMKTS